MLELVNFFLPNSQPTMLLGGVSNIFIVGSYVG